MASSLAHKSKEPASIIGFKPHQKLKIAHICGSQKVIQRLSDLGLTPMSEIAILRNGRRKGPITLLVRRTTLAVAHDIAEGIFVNHQS